MAYRNKYLKYKTKYLELTNTLRGGVKPALTPLIFGNDTKFIIFQDTDKKIQFSSIPIDASDDLEAFTQFLDFKRTISYQDNNTVFIHNIGTHIYIYCKSTSIKDEQDVSIKIDVITRISSRMEVAYLFERVELNSVSVLLTPNYLIDTSFNIAQDYLFNQIFEKVKPSLNDVSDQFLSFLKNSPESINCILYKEEIKIGLPEIKIGLSDIKKDLPKIKKVCTIHSSPQGTVNKKFIIFKEVQNDNYVNTVEYSVDHIVLKSDFIIISDEDVSKYIISDEDISKYIIITYAKSHTVKFLYLRVRVLKSITIILDEVTFDIDVTILISRTAQISYLCELKSDVGIIVTEKTTENIFTQIFEQVGKLILTKQELIDILKRCRGINIILHKEEITIVFSNKLDM